MNKFQKIGAVALLSMLVMGCDKAGNNTAGSANTTDAATVVADAKAELSNLMNLDKEFNPALAAIQKKVGEARANKDEGAIKAASTEFFNLMDGAIQKYSGLSLKNADVSGLRDKIVSVLKDTVDFTKSAQEAKTDEAKKAVMEKQQALVKNAQELQQAQGALAQKLGLAPKAPAPKAEEAK